MPCNSLHVFINEIRQSVSIPVLSIVEETVKYLNSNGYKRVGLISTSATVANKVYEQEFQKNDISFITPNDLQKAQMDKIVQRLINGQHVNKDRNIIMSIVEELSNNVDCVALACTDLQLLLPTSDKVPIFDTMKILAQSTTREILD
jgi:aspartate racemase